MIEVGFSSLNFKEFCSKIYRILLRLHAVIGGCRMLVWKWFIHRL